MPDAQNDTFSRLAPLFVILGASLWGIDGILLRPSLYGLPVPLVVFAESSLITVLLSIFLFKYLPEIKTLNATQLWGFVGVALLGGVIGTMSITKALFFVNFVNLSIVILIQKLQPVIAITLAALFLKERPPRVFYLWAGVAIFGAYLMTFGIDSPNLSTGDKTMVAAFFALLAATGFASSTVLSKYSLTNTSFQLGTYLRFSFTAIIMSIIAFSTGDLQHFDSITSQQVMIFLLIAFITGGPAIFLYYYGLKKITASTATICELAFPLTAVILEYVYHGHILGPVQWIGVAILFAGILKVSGLQTRQGS